MAVAARPNTAKDVYIFVDGVERGMLVIRILRSRHDQCTI